MTGHYAYVLWSDKLQKRYVGYTTDPAARISQHNQGWAKFTSRGIPWVLLYTEEYATALEAKRRERFFKTGTGRAFLDRVLAGSVSGLAEELPPERLAFRLY